MIKIFAIAGLASLLSAADAYAVGFLTQMNCASDYYAYCSQFQVGSKELRICMRRVGPKLSKSCLNALIADGEVSQAEINAKKQELTAAKAPAKPKPVVEQQVAEIPKKRDTLALKQSTFEALKSRAPRFVELASASEAQEFAVEPDIRDPARQEQAVVPDPSPTPDAKPETPRKKSEASRAKTVKNNEPAQRKKLKNKYAANKVQPRHSKR